MLSKKELHRSLQVNTWFGLGCLQDGWGLRAAAIKTKCTMGRQFEANNHASGKTQVRIFLHFFGCLRTARARSP